MSWLVYGVWGMGYSWVGFMVVIERLLPYPTPYALSPRSLHG